MTCVSSSIISISEIKPRKPRNASEVNHLIRLPTIKVEKEENISPSIKIIKTQTHKPKISRLHILRAKSPLKILDFTDKLFRDIPKFSFQDAIISPKHKTKLIISVDSPSFDESSKNFNKRQAKTPNRKKIFRSSTKRYHNQVNNKDSEVSQEFMTEYQKKKYENTFNRPVSPWLYRGKIQKSSIFFL